MNHAKFVTEISVIDPDSKAPVEIAVYKHIESGAMFAVDSSFIDQVLEEDSSIPDPFNPTENVVLID